MTDLRDLLDDASRPDQPGADPHTLLRAGRGRVRRRALARTGGALALAVVVAVTALVARPWSEDSERRIDPVSPTQPVAPSDPSPTRETGVDPDHTPPGTELAIGQTARVPIDHRGPGEVELTVTGIQRGENADVLSVLDPDPNSDLPSMARRGTFWYVDVRIDHVSGGTGGYYLDPDVTSVVSGGRVLSQWNMVAGTPFAPCPSRGLGRPRPGSGVDDCLVFQTVAGAEVVGLRFGQFETAYDVRSGDPVVWR